MPSILSPGAYLLVHDKQTMFCAYYQNLDVSFNCGPFVWIWTIGRCNKIAHIRASNFRLSPNFSVNAVCANSATLPLLMKRKVDLSSSLEVVWMFSESYSSSFRLLILSFYLSVYSSFIMLSPNISKTIDYHRWLWMRLALLWEDNTRRKPIIVKMEPTIVRHIFRCASIS